RLEHPLLGYSVPQQALRETLVKHLAERYGWQIDAQDLVFLPGVEPGVNMALHALVSPASAVLVQTPNYSPLLHAPANWKLPRIDLPFHANSQGEYPTDIAALERALPDHGALLLSNPHNPLGIRHTPIASLSPEIAARSVTLMSASKAWNIAGLKTAFAVVQNAELRQRFNAGRLGLVDSVNALGLEATEVAYREGGPWLAQVVTYLQDNRDYLAEAINTRFPGITMHLPQSTYLAWLDCSGLGLKNPQQFFLEHAKVALSDGLEFGDDCGQFVRLNFGCPRPMLKEGLARMERSLRDA
ncbi:aminotransferase, partial [Pseudomonas sp. NZIPFR-PS5]